MANRKGSARALPHLSERNPRLFQKIKAESAGFTYVQIGQKSGYTAEHVRLFLSLRKPVSPLAEKAIIRAVGKLIFQHNAEGAAVEAEYEAYRSGSGAEAALTA